MNDQIKIFFTLIFLILIVIDRDTMASVTGTVTDITEKPVQGALVTITENEQSENEFTTFTDNYGRYSFPISTVFAEEDIPLKFSLMQNYPNPFNPSTTISYTLEKEGYVNLSIFTITGQKIRTLVNDYQRSGLHKIVWDGVDNNGSTAGAGVYIYQLRNNQNVQSRKMLLLDGGYSFQRTPELSYKKDAKASGANEDRLFTFSVMKGGYHTFIQNNVSFFNRDTFDVILTPYESLYRADITSENNKIILNDYNGINIEVSLTGIGEEQIGGLQVFSITNVYGSSIICIEPQFLFFDTLYHLLPSSAQNISTTTRLPLLVIDQATNGKNTQKFEKEEAIFLWKDIQILPELDNSWNKYQPGTWNQSDTWNEIEKVILITRTGSITSKFSLFITTSVKESAQEIITHEYNNNVAIVNSSNSLAILMNDCIVSTNGSIIGRVQSFNNVVGIQGIEITATGPSGSTDPVMTDWKGYFNIRNLFPGSYTLSTKETNVVSISIGENNERRFYGCKNEYIIIKPIYVVDYNDTTRTVVIKTGLTEEANIELHPTTNLPHSPSFVYRKYGEKTFHGASMKNIDGENYKFEGNTVPSYVPSDGMYEYKVTIDYFGNRIESPLYFITVLPPITQFEGIAFISFFVSNKDEREYRLNIIEPDGIHQKTFDISPYLFGHPVISPDHTKIAYFALSKNLSDYEIFLLHIESSEKINLTASIGDDEYPSWSPDGNKIAYMSDSLNGSWDIFVMNADGSNKINITNTVEHEWLPSWSPDGTKIVFNKQGGIQEGIFIMNTDGSNQKRLTDYYGDYCPSWSPDGSQIVFYSKRKRNSSTDIYIIDADGENMINITESPYEDLFPGWSPDGSQIVFISKRNENYTNLYIINKDGSSLIKLTNDYKDDLYPSWSRK